MSLLSSLWTKSKNAGADLAARQIYPLANAFWGMSFRTCCLRDLETLTQPIFYVKAQCNADGKWTVLKMTAQKMPGETETEYASKILTRNRTFFEAMDYTAKFEVAGVSLNEVIVDPAEKDALGFSHYQAFGRREGILFDKNGLPHQTDLGEIATEGNFSESEIQLLTQQFLKRTDLFTLSPGVAEERAFLAEFLPDHKTPALTMKALETCLKTRDEINEDFLNYIFQAEAYWKEGLEKGFEADVTLSYEITPNTPYKNALRCLSLALVRGAYVKALKDLPAREVELAQFFIHLSWIKQTMFKVMQGDAAYKDRVYSINSVRERVMTLNKSLSISGITEFYLDQVALQGAAEKVTEIPPIVASFFKKCREMKDGLNQEIYKNMTKLPEAAP